MVVELHAPFRCWTIAFKRCLDDYQIACILNCFCLVIVVLRMMLLRHASMPIADGFALRFYYLLAFPVVVMSLFMFCMCIDLVYPLLDA